MTAGPRRVHGTTNDNRWIVRYDVAGKWFAERHAFDPDRERLTLAEAVDLVTQQGAVPYWNVEGGQRFEAEVRKVLRARAA